jgi:hypothetical protein
MEGHTRGALESRADFKDDESDQYRYWLAEMDNADKRLSSFRKLGTKTVKKYTGGSRAVRESGTPDERSGNFRLNLYHSNVHTLQSMLYGNLPKVTVGRRHQDPNDDVGRVAAMMLERLLNNDIQDNGKEYNSVLRAVLQDRLLPGLGCARVRYTAEEGEEGEMATEDAPIDYFHWRDVSWGWGRTFSDLPWIGFRSFLRKDDVRDRFGDEAALGVQLKNEGVVSNRQDEPQDVDEDSPWKKAEVWEIWDKTKRKVVWMSPGYDKILDTRDDTLGLSGFYPCPPFLLANQTTSLYIPTSDYALAQDLYNEVDILQTRISIITEAVKVVGVYDRSAEGIQRMFKEGTDNDLIPVDNWALFAEKGGIEGQIDWVPIDEISQTLLRLRELRDEAIGLLQQVTGMTDIMRGELQSAQEGVGQSELKVKFGSVRVQALQDEFAAFASDLLQIKAEIIGRHFDPETIAVYANIDETFDAALVPDAIALLKTPDEARMRVEIRPESVAMVDYAQLKQERVEYITAISTFMQSANPIIENDPSAKPFMLELLKWGLAGFKGAKQIEGVMDKAIEASMKASQEEEENGGKPDPDAAKETAKAEGQMQLEQMKHDNTMKQIEGKMHADLTIRKADLVADQATMMTNAQADLQQTMGEMQSALTEIKAKLSADLQLERASMESNVGQSAIQGQIEMAKDKQETMLEIAKQQHQGHQKLQEISANAQKESMKASQQLIIEKVKAAEAIKVEKAKPKPTSGGSDDSSSSS